MKRWENAILFGGLMAGLAGRLGQPVSSRTSCAECHKEIPPGRAGRRCLECRKKPSYPTHAEDTGRISSSS